MDNKTDLEILKEAFDSIGVGYTEQTNEENSDVLPAHVVLYADEFMFVFKKKNGIFVDTRNVGME